MSVWPLKQTCRAVSTNSCAGAGRSRLTAKSGSQKGHCRLDLRNRSDVPLKTMWYRVVNSLVLCCGLLLALPPGWCCTIAFEAGVKTAPKTAAFHCPLCCDITPEPAPSQPEPPRPEACPICGDRDLVKPAQPETLAVDVAGPVLTLPSDLVVVAAFLPAVLESGSDRTIPLHMLHCVWTC